MNIIERIKKIEKEKACKTIKEKTEQIKELEEELQKLKSQSNEIGLRLSEKTEESKKYASIDMSIIDDLKFIMDLYQNGKIIAIDEIGYKLDEINQGPEELRYKGISKQTEEERKISFEQIETILAFIKKVFSNNNNDITKKLTIEEIEEIAKKFIENDKFFINGNNIYYIKKQISDLKSIVAELKRDKTKNEEEIQNINAEIDYDIKCEAYFNEIDKYRDKYNKLLEILDRRSTITKSYEGLEEIKAKLDYYCEMKKQKSEINGEIRKIQKEKTSNGQTFSKTKDAIQKSKKIIDNLQGNIENIEKAETIGDFRCKTNEELIKKFRLNVKKLIIVPIKDNISSFDEMFNRNIPVSIKVNNLELNTTYNSNTIVGVLNSTKTIDNQTSSVLIIPLDSLKKDDIIRITEDNQIVLKKFNKLPKGAYFISENKSVAGINAQRCNKKNIKLEIDGKLGEDCVDLSAAQLREYEILRTTGKEITDEEEKSKKDAIISVLYENLLDSDIQKKADIQIDGKEEKSKDYQNALIEYKEDKKVYKKGANRIIQELNNYFQDPSKSAEIDRVYSKLLKEYLSIQRKEKARYNFDEKANIGINDEVISIKPPHYNQDINKKYTRKNEDIVYKTMKLAVLTNKYAKQFSAEEYGDIQEGLYEVKRNLVERVIDLSKKNNNIKIGAKFDEIRSANAVVLEIPGYGIYSLHIIDGGPKLNRKISKLKDKKEYKGPIYFNADAIMIGGVNQELIKKLLSIESISERQKIIMQMNDETFCNLLIRLDYSLEDFDTKEKRTQVIQEICTDEKLKSILKEQEEMYLDI